MRGRVGIHLTDPEGALVRGQRGHLGTGQGRRRVTGQHDPVEVAAPGAVGQGAGQECAGDRRAAGAVQIDHPVRYTLGGQFLADRLDRWRAIGQHQHVQVHAAVWPGRFGHRLGAARHVRAGVLGGRRTAGCGERGHAQSRSKHGDRGTRSGRLPHDDSCQVPQFGSMPVRGTCRRSGLVSQAAGMSSTSRYRTAREAASSREWTPSLMSSDCTWVRTGRPADAQRGGHPGRVQAVDQEPQALAFTGRQEGGQPLHVIQRRGPPGRWRPWGRRRRSRPAAPG